jgi:glycosyltransferase involved in cell wall biosynthesis
MHTIGVAIPVKNAVSYVGDTIRAIYAQSRRPDRVVVVDNGSQDGTVKLLQRLKDQFGFRLLSEPQPGASAARDTAWRALDDCDLVAFCDADDLWQPEKLEQQAALFEHDTGDLVCVYCANLQLDGNGREIGRSDLPRLAGNVFESVRQGHPILGSMSAILVRRAALEKIEGFDRSLLADEDLDLFIRLSRVGRFDFVPRHLVALRQHESQTSRNVLRLLRSKGQIINKYPDLYQAYSPFIESIRIEHLRADLGRVSGLKRLMRAAVYPLIFQAQVRRAVSGPAKQILFPGLLSYSLWLTGRTMIFASNRLADRRRSAS